MAKGMVKKTKEELLSSTDVKEYNRLHSKKSYDHKKEKLLDEVCKECGIVDKEFISVDGKKGKITLKFPGKEECKQFFNGYYDSRKIVEK